MENKMKEEWRPVKGFEDYAEISNMGQVHRFERVYYCGKNQKSKRIQEEDWTYGSENNKGYLYATIGGKPFRVNRLVYITFVGEIPDGLEVNHIDEDKHNNRLDNLNLLSHGDNVRYGTGIERRAAAKNKAVQALDKDGNVVMEFASIMEAQRQGFDAGHISKCCRGERKTHKGYIWCFKEKNEHHKI